MADPIFPEEAVRAALAAVEADNPVTRQNIDEHDVTVILAAGYPHLAAHALREYGQTHAGPMEVARATWRRGVGHGLDHAAGIVDTTSATLHDGDPDTHRAITAVLTAVAARLRVNAKLAAAGEDNPP